MARGVELSGGEENLLGNFHPSGINRRYGAAVLVGGGRHVSDSVLQLVGRLPQRLVLVARARFVRPRGDVFAAWQRLSAGGDL